ncbi:MAG: MFS transporter [Alphaproteobacteria bacterium]
MIQSTNFTFKGIIVWLICAVFFLYEFLLRTVVGTFQHPIMYDLDLSAIEFALISSTAYLAIYAIMQIPVGLIVDRIGLKNSLLIGASICAASSIGFSYVDSYLWAIILRFSTGFGSSFGFICLLVAVYEWLPRKYIAFLVGVSQFIGTMGPMIAAGPFEYIAETGNIDWRTIFYALGFFGIILTVLIALYVSNNQEKSGQYTVLKRPDGITKILAALLTNRQAWIIAVFSGCIYFSLEYLSENDGKNFLISKGLPSTLSAFMITFSWLGYALACPVLGSLSDYFKRRKPFMVISAFLGTSGLVGIVFCSQEAFLAASFFLLGIGAAGQSLGFVAMSEQFKPTHLAAGLSFNNGILMMLSAVNAPVIGSILEHIKIGTYPSMDDYQFAFSFLIAAMSISIILSTYFFRETYGKSQADYTYLKRT